MKRALSFSLLLMGACSSKAPPPPAEVPCVVRLAGAVSDTLTATTCGVTTDDAGTRAFAVHATGATVTTFDLSFDLASIGSSWSASATTGDAGCSFVAGSDDVPTGSIDVAIDPSSDAGATVHGTVSVVMLVHAPASTNCGPHDVENVELTF